MVSSDKGKRIMDTCGCRYEPIIDPMGHCVGGNIIYCAKHAAANAMYEALKSRYSYEVARYWKRYTKPKRFWVRYERLIHGKERAALALADGDKGGG